MTVIRSCIDLHHRLPSLGSDAVILADLPQLLVLDLSQFSGNIVKIESLPKTVRIKEELPSLLSLAVRAAWLGIRYMLMSAGDKVQVVGCAGTHSPQVDRARDFRSATCRMEGS